MDIVTIKDSDILLITVDVGNMSPSRAKTYLQDIESKFGELFDNRTLFIAGRSLPHRAAIQILRKE